MEIVVPFLINDAVPDNEEVEWDTNRLHSNHSGGPLGMRADKLRRWMAEYRKSEAATGIWTGTDMETNPQAPSNWGKVVEIIQTTFQ